MTKPEQQDDALRHAALAERAAESVSGIADDFAFPTEGIPMAFAACG